MCSFKYFCPGLVYFSGSPAQAMMHLTFLFYFFNVSYKRAKNAIFALKCHLEALLRCSNKDQ